MTIATHKLLVLFLCVSSAPAIAMLSKDFQKVMDKTAPAYSKKTVSSPKKSHPHTNIEKKKFLQRKDERLNKYNVPENFLMS
jgi:hypothetical protein